MGGNEPTFGIQEFFRFALPGYIFSLLVAPLIFANPKLFGLASYELFQSASISGLLLIVFAGYPLGTIFYLLFTFTHISIFKGWMKRGHILAIKEMNPKFDETKIRAVWESWLFTENNKAPLGRIVHLKTQVSGSGAILTASVLGFMLSLFAFFQPRIVIETGAYFLALYLALYLAVVCIYLAVSLLHRFFSRSTEWLHSLSSRLLHSKLPFAVSLMLALLFAYMQTGRGLIAIPGAYLIFAFVNYSLCKQYLTALDEFEKVQVKLNARQLKLMLAEVK